MDAEIQLVSDGENLAIFGDASAVEGFLRSQELASSELNPRQVNSLLSGLADAAQAGSHYSANSGRWLKLTEESAQLRKLLPAVSNSKTGYISGTLRASNGQFAKHLQFINPKSAAGLAASLASPAFLAGAASILSQHALQQSINEINEYLEVIEAKIDLITQRQEDAILAELLGIEAILEEAMTVRGSVGRVSETIWSNVQGTSGTIGKIESQAILELGRLTKRLENISKVNDIAKASKEIEPQVVKWLALLAHCQRLLDQQSILELDRVLDVDPEDLNAHRIGLNTARQNRLQKIGVKTQELLKRLTEAGQTANTKILLQPFPAQKAITSCAYLSKSVIEFHEHLGLETDQELLKGRRWLEAVVEVKDSALETGAEGVDIALRISQKGYSQAKSITGKLSSGISERTQRLKGKPQDSIEAPPQDPDNQD